MAGYNHSKIQTDTLPYVSSPCLLWQVWEATIPNTSAVQLPKKIQGAIRVNTGFLPYEVFRPIPWEFNPPKEGWGGADAYQVE